MASALYSMLFLFVLSGFHSIVGAQDLRAPHGLAYETPAGAAADGGAVSPEAYAFFNPAAGTGPKNSTAAAAQFPAAAASSLESNLARDSVAKTEDGGGGGGGMVGILIGFLFVVVLVLGVFFVVTTRKRNWTKANAADMPQA
ncbi:PREDICTED: uncharacterized protein LOC109162274 [Ipomoea nil]|uniref:uncharacterized protein LOC109162274 n=1 Tax=Ipomoea nil TaxID=35883 RepID=UPI00090084CA|nr:PREDICTED: uncharacterized protein LOC109162274 [Ipomoea nil]